MYDFEELSRTVKSRLVHTPSSSFKIHTTGPGQNFAQLGFSVSSLLIPNIMIFFDYDAEVGRDHFFVQSIDAGLRMEF